MFSNSSVSVAATENSSWEDTSYLCFPALINAEGMFYNCSSLGAFGGNEFSNITNCHEMFRKSNHQSLPNNLLGLRNVTNILYLGFTQSIQLRSTFTFTEHRYFTMYYMVIDFLKIINDFVIYVTKMSHKEN